MKIDKEVLILCSILLVQTLGDSSGEDDDGEMTVPRSPRISGERTVYISYKFGEELDNLVCYMEGSPTPTVMWFKDGKRVTEDLFETDFDAQDGKATLEFKNEKANLKTGGNYSCVGANFLGRASKTFILSIILPPPPPLLQITTRETKSTESLPLATSKAENEQISTTTTTSQGSISISLTTKSNKPIVQINPEQNILTIK